MEHRGGKKNARSGLDGIVERLNGGRDIDGETHRLNQRPRDGDEDQRKDDPPVNAPYVEALRHRLLLPSEVGAFDAEDGGRRDGRHRRADSDRRNHPSIQGAQLTQRNVQANTVQVRAWLPA